jgi:hypothetical protein
VLASCGDDGDVRVWTLKAASSWKGVVAAADTTADNNDDAFDGNDSGRETATHRCLTLQVRCVFCCHLLHLCFGGVLCVFCDIASVVCVASCGETATRRCLTPQGRWVCLQFAFLFCAVPVLLFSRCLIYTCTSHNTHQLT